MLIWFESPGFQGFGCSACDWKFRPVGALTGQSLDEMKKTFEDQRDREFAAHTCVKSASPTGRTTRQDKTN